MAERSRIILASAIHFVFWILTRSFYVVSYRQVGQTKDLKTDGLDKTRNLQSTQLD